MSDWFDWLFGATGGGKRRWIHRRFHLSENVVTWLQRPACTHAQRCAFAELLLKLDADPLSVSRPVLRVGAPPGMRWAPFDAHKAIFVWDAARDQITVDKCV